jgi:hypothetical protein
MCARVGARGDRPHGSYHAGPRNFDTPVCSTSSFYLPSFSATHYVRLQPAPAGFRRTADGPHRACCRSSLCQPLVLTELFAPAVGARRAHCWLALTKLVVGSLSPPSAGMPPTSYNLLHVGPSFEGKGGNRLLKMRS